MGLKTRGLSLSLFLMLVACTPSANPVANVDSPSFRADELPHFAYPESLLPSLGLWSRPALPGPDFDPDDPEHGRRVSAAVAAIERETHRQGALLPDPTPLHWAIDGPGYFVVQTLSGQRYYTRNGRFRRNADGQIVTASGVQLVPSTRIPAEIQSVLLAEDGSLWGRSEGAAQTGPERFLLGRIWLAYFPHSAALQPLSGGRDALYRASSASGTAGLTQPGQRGFGLLVDRAREDFTGPQLTLHEMEHDCQSQQTGWALDWGIKGPGFFVLEDPLTGERLFTRQGRFKVVQRGESLLLSPEGEVTTQHGYRLSEVTQFERSADLQRYGVGGLILSPEQRFDHIDAGGGLYVAATAGDSGSLLGQLQLARFDDPSILEPLGFSRPNILHVRPEVVAQAQSADQLFHLVRPGELGAGQIQAGQLESCGQDLVAFPLG